MSATIETASALPRGWKKVRVKDVAKAIQYGYTASAINRKTGPRFLRITDIQNGHVDWSIVPSCDIPEEDLSKYRLLPGDLVFARTGATTGKSFLIGDCPEAVFASYLIRVRVADDVSPKYLSAYFQSSDYWRQIESGKRGIGQPNVNGKVLGDIEFPLAPLDEQHEIVAEIEKQFTRLEAGVAGLRRVQSNRKRYRAAVLKAACEGKLVPTEACLRQAERGRQAKLARQEGRSYETGAQLLERILAERRQKWNGKGKYNEPVKPDTTNLAPLPEGWAWATIDQLAIVVRGASPRPAGDSRYFGGPIPWITVGPITADSKPYLTSVPETVTAAGRDRSRYIEPETLLLTNSGATLGVPKITSIGGCINDGVAALLEVDYPLKLYLLYYLHSLTMKLRGVNQGAAQPNLNTSIIKSINVPLPSIAEQGRIVAELERRLSVIEELESAVKLNLHRASSLHASILQQFFKGE